MARCASLVGEMNAGTVAVLLVLGANPCSPRRPT
jgi:hypothetical protein